MDVTVGDCRLLLGDCLDRMAEIPDGSVNLIATDLPYGTTACKWDSVIPFKPLWQHYKRILKPNGVIVSTASQPFTSALVASNWEWLKYCLIWEKSKVGGFLDAKYRPLKSHEDIVVFSPAGCSNGSNPAMTYNPVMTDGEAYTTNPRETSKLGLSSSRSETKRTATISDGKRYPKSVWYFANDRGGAAPDAKIRGAF